MPSYKLTYFDVRGRGEVPRQLFALAGVPYEDVRITFEEWAEKKGTLQLPYGQLPILEVDGVILAQSGAIARFLAKRFGYYGENDFEAAQIDEFLDAFTDFFTEQKMFFPIYIGKMEGDKEAARKELFEPARDKYFPIFVERFLKKSAIGFLVGSKLSYADLALAGQTLCLLDFMPDCMDKYPELVAHLDLVNSVPAIKEWIEKRPKNAF
ncbi:unnamed protein product, partial [Mesorhabditis belari]|uniref:glutathione transferase n=1 Tax=Mesorhabditis belari TaxID=2138241 RepID=A0AAF3FGC6_9BILA